MGKLVVQQIHHEADFLDGKERTYSFKFAIKSEQEPAINHMLNLARSAVPVTPEELDADGNLLNLQNGTLELDTFMFREHRREDLLTKIAGISYDPAVEYPQWLSHLDLIFDGNKENIDAFQVICGYSLFAENPAQVMFILYGTGSNGKSTTLDVLTKIWGDYARNADPSSFMIQKHDRIRTDLAYLAGARFVTAVEPESGHRLAESLVKQLTGGDRVTVRHLYEEEFEFKSGMKIWLATNHRPVIRGTDEAIWRRIWLLPFTVTIPASERVPDYNQKLIAEAPGILNWCLDGLKRYREEGLRPPASVKIATQEYREDSDILGDFIQAECRQGGAVYRQDLYWDYTKWCNLSEEHPMSNRTFYAAMRERGYKEIRDRLGRYFQGISLISQSNLPMNDDSVHTSGNNQWFSSDPEVTVRGGP